MTGVDALHSYDPIAIFRVVYELLVGTPAGKVATTTDFALQAHTSISSFFGLAPYVLINFFARFAVFSFFFSTVMITIVVIYAKRAIDIRKKIIASVVGLDKTEKENIKNENADNPKWKLVQEHINSLDANKWKFAILEADIILNELLDSLHLPGETMGDKLKAVDTADFKTIEDAWEGHKIRNAIAHQGSDFLLNEREAKRVIGLYEKVFLEFEII